MTENKEQQWRMRSAIGRAKSGNEIEEETETEADEDEMKDYAALVALPIRHERKIRNRVSTSRMFAPPYILPVHTTIYVRNPTLNFRLYTIAARSLNISGPFMSE